MYQKLIYIFVILILSSSCSKKEVKVDTVANDSDRSYEVYREALEEMESGDYFIASKKFAEAENILPKVEFAAKASLMSSYAL